MNVILTLLFFVTLLEVQTVNGQKTSSLSQECIDVSGTCYVLSNDTLSVSDAKIACKEINGTLAVILEDDTWIKIINESLSKFNSSVWLGIETDSNRYQYIPSVDLSKVSYWSTSRFSGRQCMFGSKDNNWQWHLSSCSSSKYFLCQTNDHCRRIPHIPFADYNACNKTTRASALPNTKIVVKCWQGYQLEGPNFTTCTNGTWSELPKCVPTCSPPTKRQNSNNAASEKPFYKVGEEIVMLCNSRYIIWKNSLKKTHYTLTCQSGGQWSNENDDCIRDSHLEVFKVEKNSSINLPCSVSRYENIEWLKSETIIKNHSKYRILQSGALEVTVTDKSDEGIYYCLTSKSNGSIIGNRFYHIVLKRNCNDEQSNDELKIHELQENLSLGLQCTGLQPDEQADWYKDNVRITSDGSDKIILLSGTLYLKNITLSDDGVYTCKIKDGSCSRNVNHKVSVIASDHTVCGTQQVSTVHHPWLVTLWRNDEIMPFCYGTLLNSQWVITSAFCLFGSHRRRSPGITVEIIRQLRNETMKIPVSSVKIHPMYRFRFNAYDVGLVKLQRPELRFASDLLPVCLDKINIAKNNSCQKDTELNEIVVGLGALEMFSVETSIPMSEPMGLVSNKECEDAGKVAFTQDMFCASSESNLFSGDSGSPFLIKWKNRIYIMGIYSWGQRALRMGQYDYFTNTQSHYDWISKIITRG